MSSIFVQRRLEDEAILLMLINVKKLFPTMQRACSNVLEQFSMPLKEVDMFVLEKCFSIDDLHLKNIWFIVSKEAKQLRLVAFEFTYTTR